MQKRKQLKAQIAMNTRLKKKVSCLRRNPQKRKQGFKNNHQMKIVLLTI